MDAKEFFSTLESEADPARIAGIEHSYVFEIEGEGRWLVEIHDGTLKVTEGWEGGADAIISTSSQTFDRLASRQQSPMTAVLTGKVKIDGDYGAAMKLQKVF
jgi:putative sterol carrier protein